MPKSRFDRVLGFVARRTARLAPWHKWPFAVAIPTLAGTRVNMRWGNLFDTQLAPVPVGEPHVDVQTERTADGSYNDLEKPWMGMAGARFGRNFPIEETFGLEGDALTKPSPRAISNKLLARKEFVPVPHLNLFVSAWLQFMVHDWLSHGSALQDNPHKIDLDEGDDWHEKPMTVLRTAPDTTGPDDAGRPAAYTNTETHWWDGSQIYGSTLKRQRLVRTDPATGEMRRGRQARPVGARQPADLPGRRG